MHQSAVHLLPNRSDLWKNCVSRGVGGGVLLLLLLLLGRLNKVRNPTLAKMEPTRALIAREAWAEFLHRNCGS